MLDLNTNASIEAHHKVRDPRNSKKGEHISATVVEINMKTGDQKLTKRPPMAETIFTGEN